MQRLGLALTTAALIATMGAVLGQEPEADLIASALARYEAALEGAEREYLEAKLRAHDACLEGLRDAKRDLLRAGDLSEALRLEKMEEGVRKERTRDRARLQLLEPTAWFETHGRGFGRKVLRNEANAFSNRPYVWRAVPDRLEGWRFLQIAGGDTPSISLTAKRGGVVFVATAAPEELEKKGWLRQEALGFHYSDHGRTRLAVLTRRVREGESVPIPHFSWTGTIVLIPPP